MVCPSPLVSYDKMFTMRIIRETPELIIYECNLIFVKKYAFELEKNTYFVIYILNFGVVFSGV